MTTNARLKKQAREYAATHGVAYAEARRILLEQDPIETVQNQIRVLALQQADRADGVRPYPFFIDADGFVGRQDFWRGKPFRLVGFVEDEDSYEVSLHVAEWLASEDPQIAVGKHPVLMDRDGDFATYTGPVETVTASWAPRTDPMAVHARVTSSDGKFDFIVGVGHLMEHLNQTDVQRLQDRGWRTWDMLGWLLVAPGGQDLGQVHALFDHLEETDGQVEEIVVLGVYRTLRWLSAHRPTWIS